MEVSQYINKRIKEIDEELLNLIDHDSIILLKLKKVAYSVYLELLSKCHSVRLVMNLASNFDLLNNFEALKNYGFINSYNELLEFKVSDDTKVLIPTKNIDDYVFNKIYIETSYKENIFIPDIIKRLLKDGIIE